jgi:glycosyltransferase involved in cell wall biosynthesis
MVHRASTSPLRVAILHYACPPVLGGVESIMATHARLLSANGHKPYLLAGRGDPRTIGLQGTIIPELDSRHPDILGVQKALLGDEIGSARRFEEWVECIYGLLVGALDGADACIVHNVFTMHKNLPLTAALARLAERGEGARRWIAWCHDLAWTNPLYREELQPRWPWTLISARLPGVTYVAISQQRREEMAALFGMPASDIEVVPNGIDPAAFLPASRQMLALQKEVRWGKREWVFLAPVRITRRKNLELAIDIIAAMKELGQRPLLLVTGPPGPHNVRSTEYLNELMARRAALGLTDEVVFLAVEGNMGRGMEVSDVLLDELYWWSDALLLTSTQEGFGLPILEAGLVRLPIFCTHIPVLHEVAGDNAVYFHPDDPPAEIASMMLRVLTEPGPAAMRHHVLKTYSWDVIFHSGLMRVLQPGV